MTHKKTKTAINVLINVKKKINFDTQSQNFWLSIDRKIF